MQELYFFYTFHFFPFSVKGVIIIYKASISASVFNCRLIMRHKVGQKGTREK